MLETIACGYKKKFQFGTSEYRTYGSSQHGAGCMLLFCNSFFQHIMAKIYVHTQTAVAGSADRKTWPENSAVTGSDKTMPQLPTVRKIVQNEF